MWPPVERSHYSRTSKMASSSYSATLFSVGCSTLIWSKHKLPLLKRTRCPRKGYGATTPTPNRYLFIWLYFNNGVHQSLPSGKIEQILLYFEASICIQIILSRQVHKTHQTSNSHSSNNNYHKIKIFCENGCIIRTSQSHWASIHNHFKSVKNSGAQITHFHMIL